MEANKMASYYSDTWFSRWWLPLAGTVMVGFIVHVTFTFLNKMRHERQLWNVIKDIPESFSVFQKESVSTYQHMLTECSLWPMARVRLSTGHVVYALAPEYAHRFLAPSAEKKSFASTLADDFFGGGILTSTGRKWERNRKLVSPAFQSIGSLRVYLKHFQSTAEPFLEKWSAAARAGESVDVQEDMSDMVFKALLMCGFGDVPFSEQKHNEWRNAKENILAAFTLRYESYLLSFDIIFHLTSHGRKYRDALNTFRGICRKIMREKNRIHQNYGMHEKTNKEFLDIITGSQDSSGKLLSEEDKLGEIMSFFFAGHDTTARALPFLLYNLAKHPEYQEKCRREIEHVLAGDTSFTWDTVSRLQFLDLCIKESLRTHPPIWNVNRTLRTPITLPDGRTLPIGTQTGVNIYSVLNNEKIWKNPETYDPYRFHPNNLQKLEQFAYIPFGTGPRICIGQKFALTEMRVVAAMILRRFHLVHDVTKPLQLTLAPLLKSTSGVWFKMDEI